MKVRYSVAEGRAPLYKEYFRPESVFHAGKTKAVSPSDALEGTTILHYEQALTQAGTNLTLQSKLQIKQIDYRWLTGSFLDVPVTSCGSGGQYLSNVYFSLSNRIM
ncbi:hypothetical protein TYRP_019575 [Tyrophagus putrescentiae]|nr:hypothetical protein TYRP_019575 [Tyrophagus putrescentiae]